MSDDFCESCRGLIAGGNPFSRRCDDCLDSPSCSVCSGVLNADDPESYFDPARCDDCNFDLALERGES